MELWIKLCVSMASVELVGYVDADLESNALMGEGVQPSIFLLIVVLLYLGLLNCRR